MAEAFGTIEVTHRASDDVDAGMWRILLGTYESAPRSLLKLASMHDGVGGRPGQSSVCANEGRGYFSRVSQRKIQQQVPDVQISGVFLAQGTVPSQLVARHKANTGKGADLTCYAAYF